MEKSWNFIVFESVWEPCPSLLNSMTLAPPRGNQDIMLTQTKTPERLDDEGTFSESVNMHRQLGRRGARQSESDNVVQQSIQGCIWGRVERS